CLLLSYVYQPLVPSVSIPLNKEELHADGTTHGDEAPMNVPLATLLSPRIAWRSQRALRKRTLRRLSLQALVLAALVLVGMGLFHLHLAPQASGMPALLPPPSSHSSGSGRGAGNSEPTPGSPPTPALCNPFDTACFASAISAWAAGAILNGLQPVTDVFQNSASNILTQTPPDDTYHNSMIVTINEALVHAVDIALASLLLIGGYNVILGQHVRIEHSSVTE